MTSVDTPSEPTAADRAASAPARARPATPWFGADNVASVQVSRLLFALVFLGAWQFGADRLFDSFFFSTPARILAQVGRELVDPGFYRDLGVTSLEMVVGFSVGAGCGIGL